MQISKLDFCIQEATLFLDTHPDDQEAMKYYDEGMKRLLKMKETYLKNGGALTNRDGKNYQKLNKVDHGKNTDYFCVKVFVKRRYIDAYVENKGRISTINQHINKEIQQFLQLDFNYFMYGKSE